MKKLIVLLMGIWMIGLAKAQEYTPDWSAVTDVFRGTSFAGSSLVVPVIISVLVMAVITRDMEKWKILLLPVLMLQQIIGIHVSIVLLTLAGMLFAIEALSTQLVGNILQAVAKPIVSKEFAEEMEIKRLTRRAQKMKLSDDKKKVTTLEGLRDVLKRRTIADYNVASASRASKAMSRYSFLDLFPSGLRRKR